MELNNKTEADIVFKLAKELEKNGLEVGLEREYVLRGWSKTKRKGRERKLRADITVFKNGKVICLIEVKDSPNKEYKYPRQTSKYDSVNIPYVFCRGEQMIPQAVEFATSKA